MILRKGNTLLLEQGAALVSSAAVVGRKEGEGPLADSFDRIIRDPYAGQKSWEKAESELQKQAVTLALQKANLPANEIDVMLSGDLINQCTPSPPRLSASRCWGSLAPAPRRPKALPWGL